MIKYNLSPLPGLQLLVGILTQNVKLFPDKEGVPDPGIKSGLQKGPQPTNCEIIQEV